MCVKIKLTIFSGKTLEILEIAPNFVENCQFQVKITIFGLKVVKLDTFWNLKYKNTSRICLKFGAKNQIRWFARFWSILNFLDKDMTFDTVWRLWNPKKHSKTRFHQFYLIHSWWLQKTPVSRKSTNYCSPLWVVLASNSKRMWRVSWSQGLLRCPSVSPNGTYSR